MKTHARAVVIGGGAVGCSILYHLTQAGWTDAVLLERDELTAGSTWHAAGLLPLFNMSYATGQMHLHSIDLYTRLAKDWQRDVGFKRVGNLRMARTQERMEEFQTYATTADTIGVPYEWWTPKAIKERFPLVNVEGLAGALYHSTDGYINPADITMLLADAARKGGAQIHRKTEVEAIEGLPSGEWRVKTDQGDIVAEIVVTATGNHARRTAAMVGLSIPAIPVEHQYIVTAEIPEIVQWRKEGNPEHPILRDADARWYMREERGGLILGPYEKGAPAWGAYGVPDGFRADLLPPDLDRLEWHIEEAFLRMPCFAKGGIKTTYNGPICYTPDGNPILGPAPGRPNLYFAEGFSFGITAAGGAGKYLTQIITEGEAEIDLLAVDPRRFGAYATRPYAIMKNEEAYERVFVLHYPDEERPACRPLRTTPSYDRQKARGAVFGQRFGWERANFYGPKPSDDPIFKETWSFRRGNWWSYVKAEADAIRGNVGLIEASTFAKYRATGPGVNGWMDRLIANRLPQKPGRIQLTHALTPKGGVRSEFTIMRDDDGLYIVGAGAAESYDWDYLSRTLPKDGSVHLKKVTTEVGVLVVAGPKSRQVLSQVVDRVDLSNAGFPWLTGQHCTVGMAPVRLMRVNYVGELGWEIHHPIEYQNHLFDLLEEAGRAVDMRLAGMRAMNWLRLEKTYKAWGTELSKEVTALETGLERFVRFDKNTDFVGRAALEKQKATGGLRWRLVTLLIDGPKDADPWGVESLWAGDKVAGRATGGGYSVHFGKQIAMAYVRPDFAEVGQALTMKMLGQHYPALVVEESPYDPDNLRLRADG
ncbi:MAG: GcvT family protein [Proteobacteria bacterium]|nr:GcvT family protein [Pseudomonadota bacterium]MBI3507974.1 GcvT family protein [Pseudomonadota bacterium]